MTRKEYKMKKKDKISLLIFKKEDNTISEKEHKKLNKYLEKNPDLKEEYVLIKRIREELKNSNETPLPADFKSKLREKLVDYNLNSKKVKEKSILFKINVTATAVLAVFLIAFSLKTNYYNIDNTSKKETILTQNEHSTKMAENVKESTMENRSTDTLKDTKNSPDGFIEDESYSSKNITLHEVTKENTPVSTKEAKVSSGSNRSINATSPLQTFLEKTSEIVIITNCDNKIFEDIKIEKVEENIFKIDITEYNKVINILENITYELINYNEENIIKPYFYVVNNK